MCTTIERSFDPACLGLLEQLLDTLGERLARYVIVDVSASLADRQRAQAASAGDATAAALAAPAAKRVRQVPGGSGRR